MDEELESKEWTELPCFMLYRYTSPLLNLFTKTLPPKTTLIAHAQWGLQYLVGVCVSLCHHVFCHHAQQYTEKFYQKWHFLLFWSYGRICLPCHFLKFCYTCEHAHTGTQPRGLYRLAWTKDNILPPTCESTFVGLLPLRDYSALYKTFRAIIRLKLKHLATW